MANETALKIRSDRFSSMKVTAPTAGYTAGLLTKVGSVVGAIAEAVATLASGVLIYRCEKIVVAKSVVTGNSFTVGAKVYYSSNAVYNSSTKPSGAVLCGICTVAAAVADTTVEIDLDGCLGIAS